MIKNIIKKSILVLLLLCLFSCSTNNVEEDIQVELEEEKTIDIWYVGPIEGYDDIDTWFTTRTEESSGPNASGAVGDPTFASYFESFQFLFNREDFYNDEGKYKFVLESREKGAVLTRKGKRYGIINQEGKVLFDSCLSYGTDHYGIYYIDYSTGSPYTIVLDHDYSVIQRYEDGPFHAGGSSSLAAGFVNKNGELVLPTVKNDSNLEYIDSGSTSPIGTFKLFEEALLNDYVEEDGYVLFNTYASHMDCGNYFPKTFELYDTLSGYYVFSKDNYKRLTIEEDYVAMDFSNGIIMFGKCSKKPYHGGEVDYRHFSQEYYSYELCCDNYSYSDYTYVNTEGKIIGYGYEDGYGFYEGYAPVKKNGKWGYINKQGDLVIDYIFDKATTVCDGKAWVIYKGKTGRLNLLDIIENNIELNDEVLLSNN